MAYHGALCNTHGELRAGNPVPKPLAIELERRCMDTEHSNLSAEQIMGVLRRRVGWILLCVVIVAGAAYGLSSSRPRSIRRPHRWSSTIARPTCKRLDSKRSVLVEASCHSKTPI